MTNQLISSINRPVPWEVESTAHGQKNCPGTSRELAPKNGAEPVSWQEAIMDSNLVIAGLVFIIGTFIIFSIVYYTQNQYNEKLLKNYHEFRLAFVDQERVDKILSDLAQKLDAACKQEVNLQQKPIASTFHYQDSFADAVERSQQVIIEIQENIKAWKDKFWQAHGLAKKFEYTVKSSHKDYLPKPAPPEVVQAK